MRNKPKLGNDGIVLANVVLDAFLTVATLAEGGAELTLFDNEGGGFEASTFVLDATDCLQLAKFLQKIGKKMAAHERGDYDGD